MNSDCVIVDANIVFKCLCSGRGDLRGRFGPGWHPQFFSPLFLFIELFKHKERLASAAGIEESELLQALYTLLSNIQFVNETNIPIGTWVAAYQLCKDIDEKDAAYVALTMHLEGRLWTEDLQLRNGLLARGFDRFVQA